MGPAFSCKPLGINFSQADSNHSSLNRDKSRTLKETENGFTRGLSFNTNSQAGMTGDTTSRKAPKECSKKFAATFKGKFLTRGNVLRIFDLFKEEFGAPL